MAEETENLTLYVRGMNESPEEMSDIWDDTNLKLVYETAVNTVNEQVAKRIAMQTNSNHSTSKTKSAKGKKKGTREAQKPEAPIHWKEGMPCRAIYEEDGLEYEACLIQIIDDDECIVNFLGYNNNETVPLSTLKRSQGDAARMRQIDEAAREVEEREGDDSYESRPGSESVDLYSDESSMQKATAHNDTEMPKQKKKKSNKKKSHGPESNFGELPALQMPTINMFRNMGSAEMSFPPPPPMVSLSGRSDAEEQAISDMLLSWYMTGYYTGLYQGMKKQRQSRRCH